MNERTGPDVALAALAKTLDARSVSFALVGGLAVSVRAEVRFTRDVDLAVAVASDREAEMLAHALRADGYEVLAQVEHESVGRLATVRLKSPSGVVTDLLFASSGIEGEICERATPVNLGSISAVNVARAEELVATKVLSMSERRLQDRLDAVRLVEMSAGLDLSVVRGNLELIVARGYHRDQDLEAKLESVLRAAE